MSSLILSSSGGAEVALRERNRRRHKMSRNGAQTENSPTPRSRRPIRNRSPRINRNRHCGDGAVSELIHRLRDDTCLKGGDLQVTGR
jgi:hypothetical protein